jgi:hypothetical protein
MCMTKMHQMLDVRATIEHQMTPRYCIIARDDTLKF